MDEEILLALRDLTATVDKGFSAMNERFAAIEERISMQERRTKKIYTRQAMTEDTVKKLEEIVYRLAKDEPCKIRPDGTAIRKEAAYQEFESAGVGKVKATCALRRAGVLKPGDNGRHNTCVIWLDGKPTRVLIVVGEENGKNG